jgi:hypothetical protein
LPKRVLRKNPEPTWYGIYESFMIAAAASKLLMLIFAKMLPIITASRAVASSASGSKKPLKKAEVLKIAFFTAI